MNLLDNFLNIPKLFQAVKIDFSKLLRWNGWRNEGKINGEPATPILVTGGEQNIQKMDGSVNYILYMQPLRAP